MIALEGVSTRRAPLALASVSLAWEGGAHALVGGWRDGGALVLALLAGLARPRAGRVRVLGGAPTDAAVRKQVALVPLEPALPEPMRVREAIALAASIRGEPARDEAKRLALLGVETLVERTVKSLSRAEARAVALAEAVTAANVRVILLEEPFVTMDPRAAGRLPEALRARARDGCAVIVTTGSMRDAGELADDFVVLRSGLVVNRSSALEALVDAGGEGARSASMTVVLRDPGAASALVAALAASTRRARDGADVNGAQETDAGVSVDIDVESIERTAGAVRLRGRDATTLARAAARAAIEAGVDVAELRVDMTAEGAKRPSTAPPGAP